MNTPSQIPSSTAAQIYRALEDVEHAEFGEMGGHLYVARDATGQIKALDQKGSAASLREITKWVKEALNSSELNNDQKAQMLERYKGVLNRFKFKVDWSFPASVVAFFRGQTWAASEAEAMIVLKLHELGYESEERNAGGYHMRGKFENNRLIEGIRRHTSGLIEKGHFQNDHLEGPGISCSFSNFNPTFQDGEFVKGQFVKGTKTAMYSDSNLRVVYKGSFDEKGALFGKGTKIVNGDVYEGNFTNGVINGPGKVTWYREIYEGHFRDIEGTLTWTVTKTKHTALAKFLKWIGTPGIVSGDTKAAGKYEEKITQPGTVWEGTFVNGKLKGEVKITLPDGRVGEGYFDDKGMCNSVIIPITAAERNMIRRSKWY